MRTTKIALLTTFSFLALTPCAWAHGGQFRGPTGGVPPELRPPHDAPAPPPPPPPPPPPDGTPSSPPPATPGDSPVAPPPVTPPVTPGLPGGGGGRRSALTFESWVFWYGNNKEGIERVKEALYTRTESTSPLDVLGGNRNPAGAFTGVTQPIRTKVRTHVIPALRWAMDPAHAEDRDIEGAAYIGLAKVTDDPQDIDRLLAGLAPRKDGVKDDSMVRECAALSLGLLCRREAAEQFAPAELDRVRERLFDVFADARGFETRVRGFAALSLGLLGDQPTGPAADASAAREAAAATSRRLYDLLDADFAGDDLPVGVLVALGLQGPTRVPEDVVAALQEGAVRGRLHARPVSDLVQSYAVLASARLGDGRTTRPLAGLLTARGASVHVKRSAAIGLGLLGRLLASEERVALAKTLREAVEKATDATTQDFGIMSLAYLAGYDALEGRTGVLEDGKVGAYLLEQAGEGPVGARPYAALALGWITREMGEHPGTEAQARFRDAAGRTLRDGLAGKALDARNRAAYAVALGMMRDLSSRSTLVGLVADRHADRDLRGYAALGLGLLGPTGGEAPKALRGLLQERVSEELTIHAATALGLIGDTGALDLLVQALGDVESQNAKGQIVIAMSKIGDARAVEPLVDLLEDAKVPAATRAAACSGLGVVGDLQWIPSLSKVSRDLNYRALVDLVAEVLTIL